MTKKLTIVSYFIVILCFAADIFADNNTVILDGTIIAIKVYDPPIQRKVMGKLETWLTKITVCAPVGANCREKDGPITGTKFRLYETPETKDVYDYLKWQNIHWEVELFGERDVRGCVYDMVL